MDGIEYKPLATDCPKCGGRRQFLISESGAGSCFSCKHKSPPTEGANRLPEFRVAQGLITADRWAGLSKHRILETTCRMYGLHLSTHRGVPVQVADYRDPLGTVVAQNIRDAAGDSRILGDASKATLFGMHRFRDGGRRVVVTTNEIETLAVSQALGNKWPVVGTLVDPLGHMKRNLEFLSGYDEVVLLFPRSVDAGECAALFRPGTCKVASIPFETASEMILDGQSDKLVSALWEAQTRRPDGIVSVDDVIARGLKPKAKGASWWLPSMDSVLGGRVPGEVIGLGAGTGVGKTAFLIQQAAHDIKNGHVPALFFLESTPEDVLTRIAGNLAGKAYHDPRAGHSEEEIREAMKGLSGKCWMYDSWGGADWDTIASKIRYFAKSEGVTLFTLDHLTALADPSNERESLEVVMKQMASLANELQIVIVYVSHLASPEGKSHEEGGRVTIKNFKGARAIGFWSWTIVGLERDQQASETGGLTTLRVLKDRKTGRATGWTTGLTYDHSTSRLSESSTLFTAYPSAAESGKNF